MNDGENLLDGIYNRNKSTILGFKKGIPKRLHFKNDILNVALIIIGNKSENYHTIDALDYCFLNILEQIWKEKLLKCCYNMGMEKLEINKNKKIDNQYKEEILHDSIEKFKHYLDLGKKIDNYGGYFFRILYNTRIDYYRDVAKNSHIDSDTLLGKNQLPQAAFTEKEPIDLTRLDFIAAMVELKELKNSTVIYLLESFTKEFTQSPQVRNYQRKNIKNRITHLKKSIGDPSTISTQRIILEDFEESEELKAISSDYKKGIVLKNKAIAFAQLISSKNSKYTKEELQLLTYINHTLASNLFNKVLEVDATLFKSRYNLSFCLRRRGFVQKSIMELETTLLFLNNKKDQKNYKFKMAATLEFLAELNLIDLNSPNKALELYNNALDYQSSDINIQLGLMLAQYELSQFEACELTFKKILEDISEISILDFIKNQLDNDFKKDKLERIHSQFKWFSNEISKSIFIKKH